MTDIDSLRVQVLQLRGLLDHAGDSPGTKLQAERRLASAERKLAEAEQQAGTLFPRDVTLPRAAIFLRGGSVVENVGGVSPQLAGHALINYESMYVEMTIHDERESAKSKGRVRRPRNSSKPKLLFTGTPHGSFGLEFQPVPAEDATMSELRVKAMENVATALVLVTEDTKSNFDQVIGTIPPRVLPPLKRFIGVLSEHNAELRLAFSDRPSVVVSGVSIKAAAERLEQEVSIETAWHLGVFRGVTYDTGRFDFRNEDGSITSGSILDEMTDEDIERLHGLTNKRCRAFIQSTIVKRLPEAVPSNHVLIQLEELSTAIGG